MSASSEDTTQRLANEFSRIIRDWLTPNEMAEVLRVVASPEMLPAMMCEDVPFSTKNGQRNISRRIGTSLKC